MSLKFLSWNLENFFLLPTEGPTTLLKDKVKVEKIRDIFHELSPDVAFLMEVGGNKSLNHFNENYLESTYQVALRKGNSNRGIEIGYLIKRSFLKKNGLIFDHISHANKPINFIYPHEKVANEKALIKGNKARHHSHRMSRDLSELRFYRKEDTRKEKPVLIILGVHLKSKLDKDGIDWQGTKRRRAECRYACDIFKKRMERYRNNCPLILTGDFNGECHQDKCDPEFQDLLHLDGVKDLSEHLKLAREESISFVGMDKAKKPFGLQLDYFFFHEKWKDFFIREDSGFYRYKNAEGNILPLPQNPGAKFAMVSDHYPIVATAMNDLLELQN